MIEAIAEVDDEVMRAYLDEQPLRRRSCCARRCAGRRSPGEAVPVLVGAAFKNKGVQPLLDAVVDYLPSPVDIPPVAGQGSDGGDDASAQRRRRRAVLGAGVQDHERPVRRVS